MPALGSPVTVTAPDYAGPATIVGRSTWAHGSIPAGYRVRLPAGDTLRVMPREIEVAS